MESHSCAYLACAHLSQRTRATEAAVESPNTAMAPPTSANKVQAGACAIMRPTPPIATITTRAVEASTGPPTRAAPCEEKYNDTPMPKNTKAGPAQWK